MPTLVTQTLIGSWSRVFTVDENYVDDAFAEFIRKLRREPEEQNEAMLEGIAFENAVYRLAKGGTFDTTLSKWESGIRAVATRIKGAQTQVSINRRCVINGHELVVHGKLDALKAGEIHDVKKVQKSFGSVELAGKYFDSVQHPTYFFLEPNAHLFEYDVSDGTDLYTEIYSRRETRSFERIAAEFLNWLEINGYMQLYLERWQAL